MRGESWASRMQDGPAHLQTLMQHSDFCFIIIISSSILLLPTIYVRTTDIAQRERRTMGGKPFAEQVRSFLLSSLQRAGRPVDGTKPYTMSAGHTLPLAERERGSGLHLLVELVLAAGSGIPLVSTGSCTQLCRTRG